MEELRGVIVVGWLSRRMWLLWWWSGGDGDDEEEKVIPWFDQREGRENRELFWCLYKRTPYNCKK